MICDFCGNEIKNKNEVVIEHGYDHEGEDKTFFYHPTCRIIISIKSAVKRYKSSQKNALQHLENEEE